MEKEELKKKREEVRVLFVGLQNSAYEMNQQLKSIDAELDVIRKEALQASVGNCYKDEHSFYKITGVDEYNKLVASEFVIYSEDMCEIKSPTTYFEVDELTPISLENYNSMFEWTLSILKNQHGIQ